MPKYRNAKAEAAREAKAAKKVAKREKEQKEKEDAQWAVPKTRKQLRAEEAAAKRAQDLERAQQKRALIKADQAQLDKELHKKAKKPTPKFTRVEILSIQERRRLEEAERREEEEMKRHNLVGQTSLDAGGNNRTADRILAAQEEEFGAGNVISATGIDEALVQMKSPGATVDLHPEKRAKSAYQDFFAQRLVDMKQDHPGLKLSQYKSKIFKEWKKHPDNPRNKPQPLAK